MKKIICSVLVLIMMLTLVACPVPTEDIYTKSEGVMTWEEYNAAALGTEVTIEAYVQGKQAWWSDNGVGKGSFYLQDGVGGYFLYELNCTEEEYNNLVAGTKVRVTGYKDMWSGEVEIVDATLTIIEGKYVAPFTDATEKLGTADIVKYQNMKLAFKGLTFVSMTYQGGERGKDIYVTFSLNGQNYDFCVESYLTDADSDIYKAVEALEEGDVVDVEGFAYWYDSENRKDAVYPENLNTHITGITVK
ncbi:MAG: hypothetical protein IKM40_04615 [Clostridia bacterium]|nr:hypothetical protein [Clostridia bacterium]